MKVFTLSLFFLFQTIAFAAPQKATLALNWKPEPEFGGFYFASLKKIFDQNQLQVEILPGGAGQPVAQMVAAKKVTFGISSAEEVILARANGAKIKAIFAVYQKDPHGFMVHPERNIHSLKELFQSEGIIALQKGLPFTEWLLKKYAPIKAQIVPYTGGITQFLQNKNFSQQCFVTSEPVSARHEKIDPKTLLVSESEYDPYLAVVIAHEDTLEKDLTLTKNFLKSIRYGWVSYIKNPKDTNVFMNKLNPSLSLADFDESAKIQIPFIETSETKKQGLGTMTEARWETLQKQLIDIKILKRSMPASSFFKLISE